MNQPIIIVEDELPIRDMLRYTLEKEGYSLLEAENYYELQTLLQQVTPKLILLDWMLPCLNGLEIIKRLKAKEKTANIPIIMLTARAEENYKVSGLEMGADDYMVKPFSPRELIARIQAVLRRGQATSDVLAVGKLILHISTGQLLIEEKPLKLTALELRLLQFLMENKNRIYSREQLLNRVWGNTKEVSDRSVDVQIRRLRKRLSSYGQDQLIQTVHGLGYRLMDGT